MQAARTAIRRPWRRRRGAMAVLIGAMLIVFVATLALSVDVAYIQLARTELRTATDAAARAGSEAISRQLSVPEARQAAKDAAARNSVIGTPLLLDDSDIEFGTSHAQEDGSWAFVLNGTPTNSVRVSGKRTKGSPSGPISLFFGPAIGHNYFEPVQEAIAAQLDRDICIVLDRSGSMAWDLSGEEGSYPPGGAYCKAPHPNLSRWGAAEAAVDAFLGELDLTLQEEHIALVTYASQGSWCDESYNAADIELELTASHGWVTAAVNSRGAKAIPGGTNISAGIDKGIDTLTNPATARLYAVKTMVLLTDGEHNQGPEPITSAQVAATQNITIHAITFSDGANQVDMKAVAAATGGNHYHAPDAESLQEIFQEIGATLPIVFTQ